MAHIQGRGDVLIRPRRPTFGFVGLQQDAGVSQLAGSSLATSNHPPKNLALLQRQRDPVLLGHSRASLPAR
jgi:hypothetical protein